MTDSVADQTEDPVVVDVDVCPVEHLDWQVEQLRLIARQLGDPEDSLLDAGAAAGSLFAIATIGARGLRALAAWHRSHADELFDSRGDAEQDASALVASCATRLRVFASELEDVAARHADLIDDLRQVSHHAVYEVEDDEVDDEDEYYVVVSAVRDLPDKEQVHCRYTREDVARCKARRLAEYGLPDALYSVVPVLEGERMPPVTQWSGAGSCCD